MNGRMEREREREWGSERERKENTSADYFRTVSCPARTVLGHFYRRVVRVLLPEAGAFRWQRSLSFIAARNLGTR